MLENNYKSIVLKFVDRKVKDSPNVDEAITRLTDIIQRHGSPNPSRTNGALTANARELSEYSTLLLSTINSMDESVKGIKPDMLHRLVMLKLYILGVN